MPIFSDDPDMRRGLMGERPIGELMVLGALAYNWLSTTHSSETGHDHHCPLSGLEPGDPELCSCGWSTFYSKFLELER